MSISNDLLPSFPIRPLFWHEYKRAWREAMLESSRGSSGGRGLFSRRWGVVHLRDPYFTIWPGGWQAGVAYRRHADVRRSANDWSIATRRFSPWKLPAPPPLSLPRPACHAHGRKFTRVVCVCAIVCRSSANPTKCRFHPSTRNPSRCRSLSPFVFAYASILEGGSLYITFFTFPKKWRIILC